MLELRGIAKTFGEGASAPSVQAVTEVDLAIGEGEFFSLLGPSGCGKSTLLRMLSGLEVPSRGEILLDGRRIDTLPSNKRPFNLVFQRYALFPHLSVRENVAFGLRMKRVPRHEIASRVEEMLALVQLGAYAERPVTTLSGGEQQRVAVARALVNRPRVLLLDEPLSALDLKLRQQMQVELLALQRRLKLTFVFVTHDQEEALTLSDRIAVMNQGRIEQVGSAREVYEFPRTEFVARFIGSINVLGGKVTEARPEGITIAPAIGPAGRLFHVRPPRDGAGVGALPALAPGRDAKLLVRPEKLRLLRSAPAAGDNFVEGTLKEILYQGPLTQLLIQPAQGGAPLLVLQPNTAHTARRSLGVGERVFAAWSPEDSVLL
ncbi:MAG: ABC transporter ATP-binding protein [Oligoflexia bacterium]|nr:ABC transporter ATP-binding protein [Oligoflexia bacterium]